MLSVKSTVVIATCTAGAAALAYWWIYNRRDQDPCQDDKESTDAEISKEVEIVEDIALEVKEDVQEVNEEGVISEKDEGDDVEMEEEDEEDGGMSRGSSMLSLSTSSTLGNREKKVGSMCLIAEEDEDDAEDEESEGEILEVKMVCSEADDEEETNEKNKVEVLQQEPRKVSQGRVFPPPPPRQMTYQEYRAAAIQAEWQEALAYAMRIPDFEL
eukprot:sb/3470075/